MSSTALFWRRGGKYSPFGRVFIDSEYLAAWLAVRFLTTGPRRPPVATFRTILILRRRLVGGMAVVVEGRWMCGVGGWSTLDG